MTKKDTKRESEKMRGSSPIFPSLTRIIMTAVPASTIARKNARFAAAASAPPWTKGLSTSLRVREKWKG